MVLPSPEQVQPIFIGTWVALAIVSFVVFFTAIFSGALKNRLWPIFIVGTGVLFVSFSWLADGAKPLPFFVIPIVVLITVANVRSVRFCPSCSAFQRSNRFFSAPRFCQNCGHDLQKSEHDLRGS